MADISQTDRYSLVVIDGDTGEGKSTLSKEACESTAKENGTPFSLQNNMTYLRSELVKWVDGEGEERKGQLPEHSVVLSDELISLFFKRNWYDRDQINGVELLSKCRDRHLTIFGNIPNFWDLDSAVHPHIKFWIHIVQRGVAWVFEKDKNPFTVDKWRRRENYKILQKDNSPYRCRNFLFTLTWDDWTEKGKEEYYKIRNEKRRNTEGQVRKKGVADQKREKVIKNFVRYLYNEKNLTQTEIAKISKLYDQTNIGELLKI